MADEGAEAPTVFPKIDYYFVFQTAASDFSNQHDKISKTLICEWLSNMDPRDASASKKGGGANPNIQSMQIFRILFFCLKPSLT